MRNHLSGKSASNPRMTTPAVSDSIAAPNARALVMAYGWNATAYQILNPGIDHWFAPAAPAVVGYIRRRNVMLAAGAPICPAAALPAVIRAFEDFAAARGCRVCYVCAAERLRGLLANSGRHAAIVIGAQPVWDPARWAPALMAHRSLRAQLNRARNKGVRIETLAPPRGREEPELAGVLERWLESRLMPPLHFLVEPHTLAGEVADRVVLVARRDTQAVAFLVASPAPARNGYLIEQVARDPHAPNGVSELLIDAAMRQFAGEGRAYVTLGLVALSTYAPLEANPAWLRLLMLFARAHANRFYNFRGLERFRAKLAPDRWEPIHAISNEARFSIGTLYAIGEAFSDISPWRAVSRAALRALRLEARHVRRYLAKRLGRASA